MDLRPAAPDDDAFLARIRTPEIAGELNAFDEPGEPPAADIGRMIVVLDDGTPIGSVSWHSVGYGPTGAVGHGTSASRSSPSTEAAVMARPPSDCSADHLFATTDANRVEASTDIRNIAERRSLEQAGFRREGVLRGAQYRAETWHDLVLFARLREDG